MAMKHAICLAAEIPMGGRKVVEVVGLSIGVFNVGGTFYALRNRCPHQGAPLCMGSVKGMAMPSLPGEYKWEREGEILRCPWHGWEFDLKTGRSVCDPNGVRVKAYEVSVEGHSAADEVAVLVAETYPVTVEDRWVILHV